MKKTFIFYNDWVDYTLEMNLEEKGLFLQTILLHQQGLDVGDIGPIKYIRPRVKKQLEEDNKKRNEEIKKRSLAGIEGNKVRRGNHTQSQDIASATNSSQVIADNVNVNVNDNINNKATKKRFEVVVDYDDFCTRLDGKDYSIEYPSKNIEIEKKKCWAFFDSKGKEIKDARKTFTNRLLPKARENEYIEGIKDKTDEQWIKEWQSGKTKFMDKYGQEKYSEVKEIFLQKCLNNPLSL